MTVYISITQAMRDMVKDVRAFRNRYTANEAPTDVEQQHSKLAELAVHQWLTANLGVENAREAIGDEREYFDEWAHGWRIDVKDSDHPTAAYLCYPATKRGKLETAYRANKFDGFIATSSANRDRIAILGGVSLSRFFLEGHVRGQEVGYAAVCHPNLWRGTSYYHFDCLTDPERMLRVFSTLSPSFAAAEAAE